MYKVLYKQGYVILLRLQDNGNTKLIYACAVISFHPAIDISTVYLLILQMDLVFMPRLKKFDQFFFTIELLASYPSGRECNNRRFALALQQQANAKHS
jgi:hypothetical protein